MDKYFDQQSSLPDYGKQVRVGRASNPFVNPGQNDSFPTNFIQRNVSISVDLLNPEEQVNQ
jgi:hypothetical protein